MEELAKASINARMNIFYMLDSLLDQSLALGVETYRAFITADLERIVTFTVPTDVRDGVLNRMSTMQVKKLPENRQWNTVDAHKQVLSIWKTRRMLPTTQLDAILDQLREETFSTAGSGSTSQSHSQSFSKQDILRRIEDDRERHKRLRERIWVLPIPTLHDISANPSPSLSTVLSTKQSPASPAVHEPKLVSLAAYAAENSSSTTPNGGGTSSESALDVEFEQLWETIFHGQTSRKLDHDDLKAMRDESIKCFGG